ncbi:hypothetical protein [Sinorhizobium meliloti]|uniref:hypothetical protein n=1 Tax=Rhizobium meliloti TaxID=382 RepID=UPI000FD91B3C|nr:hypothetical protein [Sinorhizobium meliloti]RVK59147.1 hypothetical protein CN162_07590 [Sinorhizobium meliloti]RVM76237.1 hypothetical protein CN126_14595 [Sinorhizobium meliloti]RVM95333.1 hypothetical protein CN122_06635 [Sinorhizobium meliloti]RVN74701.1 hypothetical protein CN110_09030 [Sinorhizobium meliloti]RVP87676.1 hypothetical protein CN096_34530 [Sinorhizobium meliloti]
MFIIKHSVQNRDDELICDELLALGGRTYEECEPHMEEQAKAYGHHGYDDKHGRWWGWNDDLRHEVHYWWPVPLIPAASA